AWPVVETVQTDGICTEVIAPAPGLSEESARAATLIGLDVAAELGVTGVMAVELFELADGSVVVKERARRPHNSPRWDSARTATLSGLGAAAELGLTGAMAVELFELADGSVLVNELAMRPHTSGHWSMDGAVTGQFEQHLRAVLDLPLGSPEARAGWTIMANVLGGEHEDLYPTYRHVMARDPGLRVHLYGKGVRPGRKIGHVTVCGEALPALRERATHAADYIQGVITQ